MHTHSQFGQLDKPRADVMINESAKAIKPRTQDSQRKLQIVVTSS